MAETSVILFELLHGWNRVNIDYMTNNCQPRISLRDYISSKYDRETATTVRDFEKTLHKLARHKNHLIFNLRCSKSKILPPSLVIQPPIRTRNGYRIAERAGWQFLQERIRSTHFRKTILQADAECRKKTLESALDKEDYENIVGKCERCADRTFVTTRDRHVAKFNRLKEALEHPPERRSNTVDRERWLVNLSSQDLMEAEETVL